MIIRQKLKEVDLFVQRIVKTYPHLAGQFFTFQRRVEEKAALDSKTKELISLALSVALKCESCIAYHSKSALNHGATPDELFEACMVATLMAGAPAIMNTQLVLQAIEELKE